jgi:hypothetical protein
MTWGFFIFTAVLYWMVTRPTVLGALLRVFLLLAFLAAFLGLMGFFVANGAWFHVLVGGGAFVFFGLAHWFVR